MIDPPKTLEEAEKYRYDRSAITPNGRTYDSKHCAYSVADFTGWHYYQCSRKNGYGPAGLYCKQHAKMVN